MDAARRAKMEGNPVLIECVLHRDGPIIVPIGNEIYHFEPDAKGRRVAEVWLEPHVEMFLASGASALYRKLEDIPLRRDDPAYTGPDPASPAPATSPPPATPTSPATPPPLTNGAAPEPHPVNQIPENSVQGKLDSELITPLSPEALAQTGIGGYARPAASSPTPTPSPTPAPSPAPTPPAQVKFDRKALIARAKELGIAKPHGVPSATLALNIAELEAA
jgi:hypothetical protein